MARRYLGYGVTNNSGVATLDHAPDGTTLSHSYTGVGAGKIGVIAESGTLQSEQYELLDALFYDKGIGGTGNYNDNWDSWTGHTVSRTRTSDYTVIEAVDTENSCYQLKYLNTSAFANATIIEFDMKQAGGLRSDVLLQIRGTNQAINGQWALSNFGDASVGEWYHYRIDLINGYVTNTTLNVTQRYSTTDAISFFFAIPQDSGHTVQYKEFKVYTDATKRISDYWNNTTALLLNDDGTITFSASGYGRSQYKVNGSTSIPFVNGKVIEFDALEISGASVRFEGYDSDYRGITVSQTGHWKVIFKDGYMTAYVDNVQFGDAVAFDTTVSTFKISFRSASATSTLKFSNLRIY